MVEALHIIEKLFVLGGILDLRSGSCIILQTYSSPHCRLYFTILSHLPKVLFASCLYTKGKSAAQVIKKKNICRNCKMFLNPLRISKQYKLLPLHLAIENSENSSANKWEEPKLWVVSRDWAVKYCSSCVPLSLSSEGFPAKLILTSLYSVTLNGFIS